ncbi:MAG TPA: hypothetical protein DD670_00250 [Planctomycetaceae bacterium]|nr:hypothetical protein [Planctomycetaceae bacterium]
MASSRFFQRHGLTILVVITFFLPMIGLGSLYALRSNRNDVKSWLPEAYEETATFKWYWEHFEGDAFILASWEGCHLGSERLAQIADALRRNNDAEAAASGTRLFSDITTGEELVERMTGKYGVAREIAIRRLRGSVVGPDERQTCLLLSISPKEILTWEARHPSSLLTRSSIFHAAVQRVYETAEQFGVDRADLHLGGPPVDNVAIDLEGERSMMKLAGVCAIVGLVLSWFTLRSWRLTLVVSTTATFSAGLSLATVWVSGTPMNAILMTMPALVFVAATSAAIHLSNYYRDALSGGMIDGATDRALRHAWIPLGLATGTTAIGLASLAVSELTPIKTFGIFSAIGIVLSFAMTCAYMPSLLEVWRPRDRRRRRTLPMASKSTWLGGRVANVGPWIVRHHGVVTTVCLAVMALGIYGIGRVETSVKLMRLFSPKARIIEDYAWLEERLGPLVPVEVIVRIDEEQSRLRLVDQVRLTEQVRRAVEEMDHVGSALAASTFAPPPPGGGVMRRSAWNTMLERNRASLDNYWSRDGQEQLWRVSARVGALNNLDYGEFVEEVRGVVEPLLQAYRDRGVKGLSASYTGVIPLVDKAQHSLFDGLLLGFTGDLALICIAIILMMRNWSAGPLLMLPSVFPLVFVFGAMGLLGIVVDTGTVMAPAVALGVTVDDAIHFMLWCRRGQQQGMSREDAILFAYGDCAEPIYQSWAVIGLGLSAFAFSAFMPTRRFGILMLTMLTVSSIGNLVFLPALLAGPAGRWFWRDRKAERRGDSELALAERRPPDSRERPLARRSNIGARST